MEERKTEEMTLPPSADNGVKRWIPAQLRDPLWLSTFSLILLSVFMSVGVAIWLNERNERREVQGDVQEIKAGPAVKCIAGEHPNSLTGPEQRASDHACVRIGNRIDEARRAVEARRVRRELRRALANGAVIVPGEGGGAGGGGDDNPAGNPRPPRPRPPVTPSPGPTTTSPPAGDSPSIGDSLDDLVNPVLDELCDLTKMAGLPVCLRQGE